jgi:ethanolamine transporter EutH
LCDIHKRGSKKSEENLKKVCKKALSIRNKVLILNSVLTAVKSTVTIEKLANFRRMKSCDDDEKVLDFGGKSGEK